MAVTEGHLDQDGVDQLVAAAGDAGLLDDVDEDFGEPLVADAATTTITVVSDGGPHVTSVYALGATSEELPGITPDQQRARNRVRAFVDLVASRAVGTSGEAYVAERYRLLPLAPDEATDVAVAPDTRDWPFADVALQEGKCVAVAGEQAGELGDVLGSATEITRWRDSTGTTFVLAVRPVLPHEPGCPG